MSRTERLCTRYAIRRVSLRSTLRVALLLGWLVAICPAAGLAGLVVQALQRVDGVLGRAQPVTISLLGQEIASIDLLQALGLRTTEQNVGALLQSVPATFLLVTLVIGLVISTALVITALVGSLGYNLLARLGGGVVVELDER